MIVKASEECLTLIKKFEGLRLKAYKDSGGNLTIGYGHTKNVTEGQVITISQAEDFLLLDVKTAEKAVKDWDSVYHWTQCEFDALTSFCFNCGRNNLNLLLANGRRSKIEIAEKIPLYNKCNGKVLKGLIIRRESEKALFISKPFEYKSANQIKVEYRVRLNYNIRQAPSQNSEKVGNTSIDGDLVSIKSLCGDWVETDKGFIHIDAFYDRFK